MKQTSKGKLGCLISLCLLLALLLAFATWFILDGRTVYPDFQKEVPSLEELAKTFADSSDVFLPPSIAPDDPSADYRYQLDGRTLLAKPIGYLINWTAECKGVSVDYGIWCYKLVGKRLPEETQYRGVDLQANSFYKDLETGTINYVENIEFVISEKLYSLKARYSSTPGSPITAQEQAELSAQLQAQLTQLAHEIIDQAVDRAEAQGTA